MKPSKPARINYDNLSYCYLDHAPVGSSRQQFLDLRFSLAQKHNNGNDPVDISQLNDDEVAEIAMFCAKLRIENKNEP